MALAQIYWSQNPTTRRAKASRRFFNAPCSRGHSHGSITRCFLLSLGHLGLVVLGTVTECSTLYQTLALCWSREHPHKIHSIKGVARHAGEFRGLNRSLSRIMVFVTSSWASAWVDFSAPAPPDRPIHPALHCKPPGLDPRLGYGYILALTGTGLEAENGIGEEMEESRALSHQRRLTAARCTKDGAVHLDSL